MELLQGLSASAMEATSPIIPVGEKIPVKIVKSELMRKTNAQGREYDVVEIQYQSGTGQKCFDNFLAEDACIWKLNNILGVTGIEAIPAKDLSKKEGYKIVLDRADQLFNYNDTLLIDVKAETFDGVERFKVCNYAAA